MQKPKSLSRRETLKLGAAGGALLAMPTACSRNKSRTEISTALVTPTGPEDEAWEKVREHFLIDPGMAYLNNASLGMPPAQVVEAVAAGYRAIAEEPLHGKLKSKDVVEPLKL